MSQTSQEATFGIGVVARRTGLSPDVLRVWERRYGAITPLRTAGGTRLYTETQVRRLELLAALVGQGHRIGILASLDEKTLLDLLLSGGGVSPPLSAPSASASGSHPANASGSALIERVLQAIEDIDSASAEALLTPAFLSLGPRCFTLELAIPLLREVGVRWERGVLSVAAEHALVAVLRSLLGGAIRRHPERHPLGRAVFATPSGQQHEFGVLAAALLASGSGVDPIYLGPDVPAPELASAARRTGAGIVVLGLAPPSPSSEGWGGYLCSLREALADGVELWVGGPGSDAAAAQAGATALASLEEFEQRLGRLRTGPGAHAAFVRDAPAPIRRDAAPAAHELLDELGSLHREIDDIVARLAARHGERLRCRKGCSGCCSDDLEVRPIEAEQIRRRHPELLRDGRPHPRGGCAFLDDEGACRIYADRPAVCRSQGLPLRLLYENEAGDLDERRDICPLNLDGGPALETLAEDDCWLIGPIELRLASLDARYLEATGRAGEVSADPRVPLRSLFGRDPSVGRDPRDPAGHESQPARTGPRLRPGSARRTTSR